MHRVIRHRNATSGSTHPTIRLFIGAGLLLMAGMVGCTQDFRVRRVEPAKSAASEPAMDPSWGWDAGQCLVALSKGGGASGQAIRNKAVARLVELYAPALLAAPDYTVEVPAEPGRMVRLSLRRGEGAGGVAPASLESLEPADRFAVTRVEKLNRTPGEGAPLVGGLRPVMPISSQGLVASQPVDGFVRAVTAVPVAGKRPGDVALALYDPHTTGQLPGSGRPLAADYTTPQALELAHFRPQRRGLRGLLSGSQYFPSTGLFPTENPTPGKTPLVLVHGLLSDPGDFHKLYARLEANAEVRRRYQVWFFYYPTSLPVVYAATLLREDVDLFIGQLDPAGTHPELHRAVLLGHSMGGLLCRMAISDGGDEFYHHFFRQPLDQLKLTPENRTLLRRTFYYRSEPDVAKVVFIATPHHGSRLASGLLGNVGRLLLRMPSTVTSTVSGILTQNRAALAETNRLKVGSSLDSLTPRGKVIAAVNDMTMRPGVRLYSILGDQGHAGPRERSSDGVVPYASSHLPEAESEVMVPAGHTGTLSRPETAAEVIRILGPSSGADVGTPGQ